MGQISSGSLTIVDVTDGAPGLNNTTVFLYQRATNAPDKPTGNLTYTFATATVLGSLEGWTQNINNLTGTNPIWMIAAVASSTGGTDVIEPNEWAGPIKMAQNGQDGQSGTNGLNQATVFIYKRGDSATAPSAVTYTFATGSFTVPSGWSKTIPTTPKGKPCWITSAIAIGAEATAELNWVTPSVLVENGSDGVSPTVTATENGVKIVDADGNETFITNGADGTSYYTFVRYSKNANGSGYVTTPTSETIYIGVYTGTKSSPPAYNDSGWTWSKYVGADGQPGTQGPTGPTGPQGVSVTATRELYYLKTNSTDPAQITSANQIYTTDDVNQWTSVVPTYIGSGKYYTCIETTLSNGNVVWSAPVENKGLTDANVNAANAIEIARGVKQHFFWVATDKSANIPAGAYVAEESEESFYSNPTKGNILTRSDGIWIRNGVDKLATLQGSGLTFLVPTGTYKGQKSVSLNGSGLTFYNIGSSNSAAATLASDGLQITNGSIVLGTTSGTSAGNVTLSNKNFTRSINGTSHNDLRFAIGDKFGVASDGTLYSSGLDSVVSRVDIAETSLGNKVDTSTFNTLSQTVDGNSASITELSAITTNNGLTKTTNITNTVNTVSQTATGNSSKISSLTQTLGTNADGTTKAGDIVHQVSQIDQDLDGVTTRVSKTEVKLAGQYATSSTGAGTTAKVATITPAVTGWTLYTGATVTVKFSTANTATTPTLNINSTGAATIKSYTGAALSEAEYKWAAGATLTFVFDGTYWRLQDSGSTAQIKVNADNINLRVQKNDVINQINVSTEGAQIYASKVDIAGAAVFNNYSTTTEMNTAIGNAVDNIQVGGRNLFVENNCIVEATASYTNHTLTNIDTDTRTSFNVQLQNCNGNTFVNTLWSGTTVSSNGHYSFTFTAANAPSTHVRFKHNGSSHDVGVRFVVGSSWAAGDELTVSFDVDGYNPSTVGGLIVKNIKLEKGNKSTDWTPAPQDVQAEIDAKKSIHTLETTYSNTYATILGLSAEGTSVGFSVTSNAGVKIGDTARIKVTVSDMSNTPVYIVGTVYEVTANGVRIYAHGLDTTVIDGGHILTGTIDANRIGAGTLSVGKLDTTTQGYIQKGVDSYDLQYVRDTRSANENPQYYITNFQRKQVNEFKYATVIGIPNAAQGSYCTLTTIVPWNDSSGGYPKQEANVNGKRYWREGTSATAWSDWKDATATATSYITHIDNNGIRVHPSSTENNSAVINANGMEIFKGGTGASSSVAFYGDTARIGKIAAPHVDISSSAISMSDGTRTTYEVVGAASGSVKLTKKYNVTISSWSGEFKDTVDLGRTVSSWSSVILTYKLNGTQSTKTYTSMPVSDGSGRYAFNATSSGTTVTIEWFHGLGAQTGDVLLLVSVEFNFNTGQQVTTSTLGAFADKTQSGPFRIGKGTASNALANGMLVDWGGNIRAGGDIIANCNNDSSGGISLAKIQTASYAFEYSSGSNYVTIDKYVVGKLVMLTITFTKTSSTASGSNLFDINLKGAQIPEPAVGMIGNETGYAVTGSTYYGAHAIGVLIEPDPNVVSVTDTMSYYHLVIRNASTSAVTASGGGTCSLMYISR